MSDSNANHRSQSAHPSTRRDFVKGSTAALGAAAAGGLSASAYAGEKAELKIALIGCGGRGTGAAAQALNTEGPVTLWAMADAFEDRLESSRKRLEKGRGVSRSPEGTTEASQVRVPPERRFVGLDAYRKVMAMDEIDVVILTTPPAFRPIQFRAAVDAGKHVFMEKPVGTDAWGINRVLAAAKKADEKNLKVGVGLNRRHSPVYQEALKRVHDGEIGRIVSSRIYNVRSGTGKYHKRQPDETELEYQVRHWYYFAWLSGDFIVEQSVHDYDVAFWMKGDYPTWAQGQGGRLVRTGKDYGHIYDHFFVDYGFADNTHLLTQHRHIPNTWNHIAEYADGTEGTASVVQKRRAKIHRPGESDPVWERDRQRGENSYQIEHDVLFANIRNNNPQNEAYYGARSTFAAILGRMAAYSGKRIAWDRALNSDKQIITEAETWDGEAPIQPKDDGGYPVATPGLTEVL